MPGVEREGPQRRPLRVTSRSGRHDPRGVTAPRLNDEPPIRPVCVVRSRQRGRSRVHTACLRRKALPGETAFNSCTPLAHLPQRCPKRTRSRPLRLGHRTCQTSDCNRGSCRRRRRSTRPDPAARIARASYLATSMRSKTPTARTEASDGPCQGASRRAPLARRCSAKFSGPRRELDARDRAEPLAMAPGVARLVGMARAVGVIVAAALARAGTALGRLQVRGVAKHRCDHEDGS
jgi:hypothetical protein